MAPSRLGSVPHAGAQAGRNLRNWIRGYRFASRLEGRVPEDGVGDAPEPGRLERYFDAHTEGPGIWKWRHYFEIYERHLSKFVDQDVHVVEIGIFSGGSLGMWRNYFGSRSHIYGIDIEPACRAYATDGVDIFIGDQADPDFWASFLRQVPRVDVLIDDGGHTAPQQMATLEAVLPHMQAGGVYICEDIVGATNPFHSYLDGLTRPINPSTVAGVHEHIESIHRYPQVVVIEKPSRPVTSFDDPRRGTEWQPFLDRQMSGPE